MQKDLSFLANLSDLERCMIELKFARLWMKANHDLIDLHLPAEEYNKRMTAKLTTDHVINKCIKKSLWQKLSPEQREIYANAMIDFDIFSSDQKVQISRK